VIGSQLAHTKYLLLKVNNLQFLFWALEIQTVTKGHHHDGPFAFQNLPAICQ
jgi:hypothetical protein